MNERIRPSQDNDPLNNESEKDAYVGALAVALQGDLEECLSHENPTGWVQYFAYETVRGISISSKALLEVIKISLTNLSVDEELARDVIDIFEKTIAIFDQDRKATGMAKEGLATLVVVIFKFLREANPDQSDRELVTRVYYALNDALNIGSSPNIMGDIEDILRKRKLI